MFDCGQAEEQTLGIEVKHEQHRRQYRHLDLVLPSAFFRCLKLKDLEPLLAIVAAASWGLG